MHVHIDDEPWLPFATQIDDKYADIALDTGLTASQNNCMILLSHRISKGKKFTLKSHAEIQKRWKEASVKLPEVSPQTNYFASTINLFLVQKGEISSNLQDRRLFLYSLLLFNVELGSQSHD